MENFDIQKIKKYFPLVDKATDNNGLITCIIAYIVVAFVVSLVMGILGIPVISWLIGSLVDLWALIGIILGIVTWLGAQNGGNSNNNGNQQQ
ncbi:MAG: hypothetical protein IJL03_11325 [Lachnospiraceae bacterium]|nr:hypothetical protein [Lachnospiraceae bacterium]